MNRALREHVTSANFALILGSTHIAALVWTDHMLRRNHTFNEDNRGTKRPDDRDPAGAQGVHRRAFSNHSTGMTGLFRRGLVVRVSPHEPGWADKRPDEIWEITEAGRLVIGLLKEAGLWAEFGGEE